MFGNVDLSTTVSDDVRDARQMVLVLLMFIGRFGPPLRDGARRHELP
ncbi:hypothetical protein [Streptomyces sp. F001]|nr:hypothetical protein [Streptomyces sp. F001]